MERSETAVTVVVTLAALSSGTNSKPLERTVAVLVMTPPSAGAVAVITIAGAAPMGRLARRQTTLAPLREQFQPAPDAFTNVIPRGSTYVTRTEGAVLGPALLMVRV